MFVFFFWVIKTPILNILFCLFIILTRERSCRVLRTRSMKKHACWNLLKMFKQFKWHHTLGSIVHRTRTPPVPKRNFPSSPEIISIMPFRFQHGSMNSALCCFNPASPVAKPRSRNTSFYVQIHTKANQENEHWTCNHRQRSYKLIPHNTNLYP